jgi:hypothetical protein
MTALADFRFEALVFMMWASPHRPFIRWGGFILIAYCGSWGTTIHFAEVPW